MNVWRPPTLAAAALVLAFSARAQTGFYTLNGGTASQSGQTYAGTATDQSGIYVLNGGALTLTSPTVTKSGDSSSNDTSSQYGLNAGILVASAASVTISGGSVTTMAGGANGLFATGTNSKITMSGGSITTSGEASHGVDVTYGGTITLTNVNVTTTGNSASAALSTDFGGGTLNVTGGVVTTSGLKSPAIYSTGTVTVTDAKLTANGGPGGVIDGANSIALNNVTLSAKTNGIYVHHTAPSSGTATVTINGGSLAATNDALYASSESGSQTVAVTVKGGAAVTTGSGNLVNAASNSTVTLTADGVTLAGNIVADSTSTVTVKLQNGAALAGTSTARSSLSVDTTSGWTVPSASALTTLSTAGRLTVATLASPVTVSGVATLGGTLVVSLGNASPAAGTYTVLTAGSVTGTFSSVTFSPALGSSQTASLSYSGTTVTLTVTGAGVTVTPPTITTQPVGCTIATGGTAVLSVGTAASGLTYQWKKDGAVVSGATLATLVLSGATASTAGSYTVTVANGSASTTSSAAKVSVVTTSDPGRLANLSTRANVGTGTAALIAGFVIGGTGVSDTEPVLIRGIGPQLSSFGLTGALSTPILTLYNASGAQLDQNTGWNASATISALAASLGAFALSATSNDCALYEAALAPGAYSAQVSGDGHTGLALAELYDATKAYGATSPRLMNISSRANVGSGDNILVAGFVITGSTAKTVLIRAAGPALAGYGLTGTLSDPRLQLFNGSGAVLATNTGWAGDAQIASVAKRVGAFIWSSATSADSALVVTLTPGAYSAQVSSVAGGTGLALVEVYDVP